MDQQIEPYYHFALEKGDIQLDPECVALIKNMNQKNKNLSWEKYYISSLNSDGSKKIRRCSDDIERVIKKWLYKRIMICVDEKIYYVPNKCLDEYKKFINCFKYETFGMFSKEAWFNFVQMVQGKEFNKSDELEALDRYLKY